LHSFPPIADEFARILVLGTMPSATSLQQVEYYAHPQNAFWWIMSQLFGFSISDDYSKRIVHLRKAQVAVWDVLEQCERPKSSLDSHIKRSSEQVNDLPTFFSQHQKLNCVGFNGLKAQEIFYRHFSQNVLDEHAIRSVLLPSSSPANARQTKEQKRQKWQTLLLEAQ